MCANEKSTDILPDTPEEEEALACILQVLFKADRVDFSHYRETTVLRRLARRASLCKQDSLVSYLAYLESNPEEIERLYDDLLLSYTRFFRDASSFDMLKQKVFPQLVANRDAKSPIRIWVPGCSTGEEVYSLAMCLHEFLDDHKITATTQLFGTDLSEHHIKLARKAVYSDDICKHVSAEQLERFFDRGKEGWSVAKFIREHCVFAVQDMTIDPPFPNIDLVSCRNVLIYFDAVFLDRSIPMFHFALKDGGFLLLGSSETVSRQTHLFNAVDRKMNLYRKCAVSSRPDYRLPLAPPRPGRFSRKSSESIADGADKASGEGGIAAQIDKALIEAYAPPGVLVDDEMRIRQFCGHVSPYLDPCAGEASLKMSKMTCESLAPDIYIALQEAKKSQKMVRKRNVVFKKDEDTNRLNLCVIPLVDATMGDTVYLILFEEIDVSDVASSVERGTDSEQDVEELLLLKKELQTEKMHLRAIIEEKDAVNQQLLAANEEVQSTNEELRSVKEEMEASKEELESANEELLALNEELVSRNEELADEKGRHQMLFDEMLDGIALHEIICDDQANPIDYRFLSINPAFEEQTGLKAKDIVGKTVLEVMPGTETRWIEAYGRVAMTGETIHFQNYSKELGKHFEVTAFRPAPNQFACTFSDITDRKLAEENETLLHGKLADAERRESLGIMAGGVAHDLNNILGPIVLLPEMIDDVLENVHSVTAEEIAEAREDLEVITSAARRGAAVISDLKALGLRGHLDLKPVDVNQMLRDCLATHDVQAILAGRRRVRLDSRLKHKKLTISADEIELHRVLLNLLGNAVESISERGHVQVEALPVSLAEQKVGYEIIAPGEYAVIHIHDTGEGIADVLRDRIFEPFVTSKKESAGASGSGLGLSVVHSIVKDHGGYIDVGRSSGKWSTTFSLYFPVVSEAMEKVEPDEKVLPRGTEHVLVVDDEPGQRFIARRGLQKLGYSVSLAVDGREALAMMTEMKRTASRSGDEPGAKYGLVLLDMIMGDGFDGLDTYEAILKLDAHQKVVIASGHAAESRGKAAQDLGAGWISKPYSISNLATTVRGKLDESSQLLR